MGITQTTSDDAYWYRPPLYRAQQNPLSSLIDLASLMPDHSSQLAASAIESSRPDYEVWYNKNRSKTTKPEN